MGKTSSKINALEKRVAQLEGNDHRREREYKNLKNQVDLLTDNDIIQMLQEVNSVYSNKPRYSYEEISQATGRSTSYISSLAKEHGLSRRNIKSVK